MDKYNVKFGCRRSWLNLGLLFTAFFLANANAYAFCAGTLIKEIKALANKPEVIEAIKASNARQLGKERIMCPDLVTLGGLGATPEFGATSSIQARTRDRVLMFSNFHS